MEADALANHVDSALFALEAEYVCFNRKLSLSQKNFGSASWQMLGDDIHIQDPTWLKNKYFNRICTTANDLTLAQQNPAIKRFDLLSISETPTQPEETFGFTQSYLLNFYQNDLSDLPHDPPSEIRVTLSDDPERFISEIARSTGRTFHEEIVDIKKDLYCSDNFRCYFARIDDAIAGFATLFLSGSAGWLANAFTYDEYRNRGVQLALLNRRLHDSVKLGLQNVYTDVVAGTVSESNVKKVGFEFAASASVWEIV